MSERDPVDNQDQPPEVDIHGGRNEQIPPANAAAERIREFVSWFGDGEVWARSECADTPPLYARDLEAVTRRVLGLDQFTASPSPAAPTPTGNKQ